MTDETKRSALERALTRPAIGLLLLLLVQGFFLHFWPKLHTANESIRFYFVESVVQEGTLSIDPAFDRYAPGWRERKSPPNIDAAVRDGRYYMDKAPGLSFLTLPVYGALHAVGATEAMERTTLWALLTFLLVTLPSLLGTAILFRLLRDLSGREGAALGLAAVYAVATPALVYSTLYFGHQLAAVLLLGAFAVLRPSDESPVGVGRAAAAGALASFAVVTEYQVVLAAAGLAVFGLQRSADNRARVALVAAGAVPAVLLLSYHWAAFGGPFDFPYAYKSFARFAETHGTGLFGFSWPSPERAYELLFGPTRGIVYAAPFLALVPLGVWRLFHVAGWKQARWPILWVAGAHTVLIFGYLYWTGGACVGARFLVPVLPFWILPLAALWRPGPMEPSMVLLRRGFLPGLAFVGVLHHALPVATFPYYPENAALSHPTFDMGIPMLLGGCVAPTTLGVEGSSAVAMFVLLLGLGCLWLWVAMRERPAIALRMRAWYTSVAFICALGVFGVQVMFAPPPERLNVVTLRSDIKSAIGCGVFRLERVPAAQTTTVDTP